MWLNNLLYFNAVYFNGAKFLKKGIVLMLTSIDFKSYEEYVQKLMKESQVPGISIGFSKDGQHIYEKGFGYRDAEKQLEASIDTVFCIGSITKSFTCIAILQLQEAGKLSVYDPINKYLPEFKIKNSDASAHMTIHHFMTHTTGIPPLNIMIDSMNRAINEDLTKDESILQVFTNEEEPTTYEELMDRISQQDIELLGPIGKQFSYQNECYCLLGAIIERVSGMTYEQYIKQSIIEPSGMEHSSFFLEELDGYNNITQPHVMRKKDGVKDVIVSPNWWDPPAMRATGLLNSTVRDMLRYSEIFRTGGTVGTERILSSNSIKLMMTPYIETNMVPGQYYGYGLMVTPDFHGATLIEHTGSGKGVSAKMQIIPEKGLAGIGLSNLYMAPTAGIIDSGMNILDNRPLKYSRLDGMNYYIPVEHLTEYVGDYLQRESGVISIGLDEEKLTFSDSASSYTLEPLDLDLFKITSRGSDGSVRFFRDVNKQINRMTFSGRICVKVK